MEAYSTVQRKGMIIRKKVPTALRGNDRIKRDKVMGTLGDDDSSH